MRPSAQSNLTKKHEKNPSGRVLEWKVLDNYKYTVGQKFASYIHIKMCEQGYYFHEIPSLLEFLWFFQKIT